MAEQLASLGIRIDADGAIRGVNNLTGSLDKLGVTSIAATRQMGFLSAIQAEATGHVGEHSLSLNRLERNMSSVVERTLGLNSSLGLLGSTFLKFGVGDIYTTGIIGGLALVTAAYAKLNEGAREAQKVHEDLLKALSSGNADRAVGPGTDLVKQTNAQRDEGMQLRARRSMLQRFGVSDDDSRIQDLNRQIAYSDKQLLAGEQALTAERMKSQPFLEAVVVHGRNYTEELRKQQKLMQDIALYDAKIASDWKGTMKDIVGWYGNVKNGAVNPFIGQMNASILSPITDNVMPSVHGINDGLTKEQIKMREKMGILIDDGNKNAETIASAVTQSAMTIVGALNIGGGGRGSGIGGALGGIAGTALGTMAAKGIGSEFGSLIAPGIGTIIGGIAGSLMGGLFDHHKKAVDRNTAALDRNTAAQLANAPSGFKAEYYNYDAADPKMIYQAQLDEARRQKQRGGKKGFALVGA